MKKKYKLSNSEVDVLKVLWNSPSPLAATDIKEHNADLNFNTIQSVLRSLMKKSLIAVADIIYHNTVLTRTFKPVITQEEYMLDQFKITTLDSNIFIAALVKNETNPKSLEALEALIKEQKNKLPKECE